MMGSVMVLDEAYKGPSQMTSDKGENEMSEKKILYLHGLAGNKPGPRRDALLALGYEVISPTLPADDMASAVEIAKTNLDGVDLVIGSSRGGAVAMRLETDKPVLLLAPCWKPYGVEGRVPNGRTTIIHGFHDEVVPYEDVETLAAKNGIADKLLLVSDDHGLSGSVDLIAMMATSILSGELD